MTVGSPPAFASHDTSKEATAEVMLYSDLEGTHPNSVPGINNGNWKLAQPSEPDAQVVHNGYSRLVEPGATGRQMRPPMNGNFWFPDYYDDHVAFAHFVACDNNNTSFDGCQTASQSVGIYDMSCPGCDLHGEYRWLEIPSAEGPSFLKGPGSVSDIAIDKLGVSGNKGRLYYIGNPNYVGYMDYDPNARTWVEPPQGATPGTDARWGAISARTVTGSCNAQRKGNISLPCEVGNEMTILKSGHIAITERQTGWIRIFRPDLTPWPGGALFQFIRAPGFDEATSKPRMLPLTIESSPVCAGQEGLGAPAPNKCKRSRFAINYDVGTNGWPNTPITEYIFDADANGGAGGFFSTHAGYAGIVPSHAAWRQTSTLQDRAGEFIKVNPGAFRAIKYDNEGSLWTSTYDPLDSCIGGGDPDTCPWGSPSTSRNRYNSSWVMAFYPQRDPTGNGNDLYAWSPGYDNSGPPACHSAFTPVGGITYKVCEPHLDPPSAPHQGSVFNSTGRFVDSLVDGGSNIYWAGWGGSFDGVVRTNPGQWPPKWVRNPMWPEMHKNPNACRNWPYDAFQPPVCIKYPDYFPRGAIGLQYGRILEWNIPYEQTASDQLTHLIYDPDRKAVWTTIQGLVVDRDRGPDPAQDPAPFQMTNIDLPQWLLRFNVKLTGQYDYLNKPFIIDPTGSMSGEPGDTVTVGAKIYSNEPLSSAMIRRDDGSGPSVIQSAKLEEILPGVYQITAKTSIPNKGSTAKYQIRAANSSGAAQPTDWFDLMPSSTANARWHFAEGYLDPNWRVFATVSNPDKNTAAKVEITFRPEPKADETSPPSAHKLTCTVAKESRLTISALDALLIGTGLPGSTPCTGGNAGWTASRGFSLSVVSVPDSGGVTTPVIAERPIYFETTFGGLGSTPVNGASNAMGVNYASDKWYFAEGTHRPGFDNYLTLSNIDENLDANVTIKLLHTATGGDRTKSVTVPKNSRRTVSITGALHAGEFTNGNLPSTADYGIEVTSDIATIVAERPIYYVTSGVIPGNSTQIAGGDVALGTPKARKRFIFSEGYVSPGFGTYVTIANPNPTQATAEVRYFTGGNQSIVKTVTVPGYGRVTDSANATLSGATNVTGGRDAGVEVRASQDVVVERPIYFASSAGLSQVVTGAHHAVGTTLARTEWGFAEGYNPPGNCSPGNRTVTEYFTITNPGLTDATADVDLLPESGPSANQKVSVRSGARVTVSAHDLACSKGLYGGYGAKITSKGAPIVVERPMYWNQGVATPFVVKGGHNVLPRHAFGLNAQDPQMLTTAYSYGQALATAYVPPPEFGVDSASGELTVTVGQSIGVEATTSGPVDRVEVRFNPFDGEPSTTELTRVGSTDSWAGSFTAAEPGVFQVIAFSGQFSHLGPARGLHIAAGGISGRVTGESVNSGVPTPVGNVTVNVFSPAEQVGTTATTADGYYHVGLPGPGDYRLSFLPNNTPGTQPGYGDRYSSHVPSWELWSPISVGETGGVYDEQLPLAGRISGTIAGANEPGAPVALGDVSLTFFSTAANRPTGRSVFTAPDGSYEIWLEPGSYHGLVNASTGPKPLGWNGYSPVWSKGQLFDAANGGSLTAIEITSPQSAAVYDEVLPKVFPVTGRVLPQGGPGLTSGGVAGSYKAIAPNGQFWAVDLPQDGNYTYPLPNGDWKIVYVVPGYELSYYHNTTQFENATTIVVSGAPVVLDDQQIYPSPP